MQSHLTVKKLVELTSESFAFVWFAGQSGAERELAGDAENSPTSLVGHLNLVRPYRIQVLGQAECEYLKGLQKNDSEGVLGQLFGTGPACLIVADGLPPAPNLARHAEQNTIPLLGSPLPSQKLVEDLQYLLARQFTRRATVHGVFLEVMGAGVLLTGKSGVGKSELALELVTRGHRLIADDAVEFALVTPDTLEGSCPPTIQNFLEVRGLGVINVRALFGDSAVKLRKNLRLIVHLEPMRPEQIRAADRLQGIHHSRQILAVTIPEVTLPVAPGRNMAVLVECTVRNYLLRIKGYDAARDFEESQLRAMEPGQAG